MATVSKREWVSKGQPKSAWIVRYVDPQGIHRQKTFSLKKAADAYCRKTENELEAGTHIAFADGKKVKEVCEEYIRHTESRIRDQQVQPTRYRQVRQFIDYGVIPLLGNKVFHTLTARDIEDWYRKLRTEPSAFRSFDNRSSPARPLSARTAKHRLSELSTMFKWAIRRGYAVSNPCGEAGEAVGRIKAVPIRTFMPEQVADLLKVADLRAKGQHRRTWLMTRCIVNLAAFCGLRYGEIMGLTLGNVHADEGWIAVRHSLREDDDVLKDPKTEAGVRDVPLPSHVAAILKDWIAHEYRDNPRHLIFRGCERNTGGDRASRIYAESFRRNYWWPLLKRAGLFGDAGDQYHFHALRHFASSWMIDNGLPITDVANLMGHSKFDMTLQVYAHPVVNGRRRSQVFDRMADRLTLSIAPPPTPQSVAQHLRIGQ